MRTCSAGSELRFRTARPVSETVHNPVARNFTNIVHYIPAPHPSHPPRRTENGLMLNRFRIFEYVPGGAGSRPALLGSVGIFAVPSRTGHRPVHLGSFRIFEYVLGGAGSRPALLGSFRKFLASAQPPKVDLRNPGRLVSSTPNGVPTGTVISVFCGASIVGCR